MKEIDRPDYLPENPGYKCCIQTGEQSLIYINDKQYIVLACGGEKLGTPKGNKIVAYAIKSHL